MVDDIAYIIHFFSMYMLLNTSYMLSNLARLKCDLISIIGIKIPLIMLLAELAPYSSRAINA